MKLSSVFLRLLTTPLFLVLLLGCQSIDRASPSDPSREPMRYRPVEALMTAAPVSPYSENNSGPGSAALGGPTHLAEQSRSLQIVLIMNDYEFTPSEIELWLGQDVILEIFNVGSRNHNITIGRDPIYKDGIPVGFELDFFHGGASYINAAGFTGGGSPDLELSFDPFLEGHEGGYPGNPHGFMAVLPTGYARFLPQKDNGWWIDNSLGPYTVGTYTLASLEFQVTREMLGEWTYASFAEEGEFYNKGMRGHLVVKSAFDLP